VSLNNILYYCLYPWSFLKELTYHVHAFSLFPGKQLRIYGKVTILNKTNVTVGNGCSMNHNVIIQGREKVVLGNYVTLSQGVMILDGGLSESDIIRSLPVKRHCSKPVTVRDHAWIGAGAIILPGVTVGESAIVGAGSVVTKNVQSGWFFAGVPAKPIRQLTHERS